MKYIFIIFCILVSLINLPGMFQGLWYSWASFVFCNLAGVFSYYVVSKDD